MNSNEVRARFLDFFASKGHTVVASSSLVPGNDPTLLFTNAGMVQFKDVFTGLDRRPYTRAVSSQRCVRAGGKHNDLENVGYTARHHTFFEMLGNFSFGDYFKQDAISYAWEFVTSPAWLGLDPKRLCVTVYAEDDEAFAIWRDTVGVPVERIIRIGDNKGARYASDNFWTMGDTGPCGPCSELFYDHDPDGSKGIWGGMPGSPEEDGDRWIEIWNLVFMQFERAKDGSMTRLPAPSVDTGMGLERISAVMQGVTDNYDIDLFRHLIEAVAAIAGVEPGSSASLKVIADHIRAACFLICDGVLPGNEGRGYVLRRIMRRAIRHGYKLGINEAFFYKLVQPLAEVMGEAYPELRAKGELLERTIRAEEDSFAITLDKGMKLFGEFALNVLHRSAARFGRKHGVEIETTAGDHEDASATYVFRSSSQLWIAEIHRATEAHVHDIVATAATALLSSRAPARLKGDREVRRALVICAPEPLSDEYKNVAKQELDNKKRERPSLSNVQLEFIDGDECRIVDGFLVFRLYDTYGFPVDLTADIARESGLTVDVDGYERAMAQQQERSRAAGKFGGGVAIRHEGPDSCFHGYERLEHAQARVIALYRDAQPVQQIAAGEDAVVVLDHTPFYAEGGGQVGDSGVLTSAGARFSVVDTRKLGGAFGHHGRLEFGSLAVGETLDASVDASRRIATMRNHSATHLLHAALREVLGTHVAQKGSLVDPARTRFDFSHGQPMSAEEIAAVEQRVNRAVLANVPVTAQEMSLDDAIVAGAMALFGEKYGDTVRVLRIGDFSTELCGGTHVARSGDIGLFKIVSESGVASGIRRVEAVTGENAISWVDGAQATLRQIAERVRGNREDALAKVEALSERARQLEREVAALKGKLASAAGSDLVSKAVEVAGVKLLAARMDGVEAADLRSLMDQLRNKMGSGVVVLGAAVAGKVSLIAGVSADLTGRVKAGEVVNAVAQQVGGKGGGRPDMAQAGGTQPEHLDSALASVAGWLGSRLGS